MSVSENYVEDTSSLPPQGIGAPSDQGDSEACVLFSIAAAVENELYLVHKVDIEQDHIMVALVQEHKKVYALKSMSPLEFNGTVLFLQDKEHQVAGVQTKKNWWKVCISYNQTVDLIYQYLQCSHLINIETFLSMFNTKVIFKNLYRSQITISVDD